MIIQFCVLMRHNIRQIILSCGKGERKKKIVLHNVFGEYLPNFLNILSCVLGCVCKHVASSWRKVILPLSLALETASDLLSLGSPQYKKDIDVLE